MRTSLLLSVALLGLTGCAGSGLRSVAWVAEPSLPADGDEPPARGFVGLRVELDDGGRLDVSWDDGVQHARVEVVDGELVLAWEGMPLHDGNVALRRFRLRILPDRPVGWSSWVHLTTEGKSVWDPARLAPVEAAERR